MGTAAAEINLGLLFGILIALGIGMILLVCTKLAFRIVMRTMFK